MKTAACALVLFALTLTACRTSPDHFVRDPFYANPSVAVRAEHREILAVESANLAEQLAGSVVVFTGEVLEVGKSRGVGSGVAMATQPVAYRVARLLKGTAASDRIVVHHVLAGGPTQDPAVSIRLNPAIWREGARLLVWARRDADGRLVCPWETPGPLASAGHAATRVRTMLE